MSSSVPIPPPRRLSISIEATSQELPATSPVTQSPTTATNNGPAYSVSYSLQDPDGGYHKGKLQYDDDNTRLLRNESAGGGVGAGAGASGAPGRNMDLKTLLKTSQMEQKLFALTFTITHEQDIPVRLAWLLVVWMDLQWLSFAFSPSLHKDLPSWVAAIFNPTRAIPDYSLNATLNIISLAIVFGILAGIGLVAFMLHMEFKVNRFFLRLLRLAIALSMTVLTIPNLTLLLSGIQCVNGFVHRWGVPCYMVSHIPLFVLNLLAIIAVVPLKLIASILLIETKPTAKDPLACAHGRVDVVSMAARCGLVLLDVLAYRADESFHWFFMVVVTVIMCYLAYFMARTQPYYSFAMTSFRTSMHMAAACAMLCSMFIRGFVGFDTQFWWIALFPSAMLGVSLGFGLSRACSKRFLQRTIRTWHRILREETSLANLGKLNGAADTGAPISVTVSTLSRTAPGGTGKAGRSYSPNSPTRSSHAIPTVEESDKVLTSLLKGSSIDALNAVQERSPPKLTNVFSDPLQVELCIRFIRQNPSPKQIAIGLQLLERGLAEFPKDAMLHLLAATYMLSYYGPQGEKVADALMRELETSRNAIPIDVKFLAWCREKALQSQGLRVLDQTLDILKREARLHHLQALTGVRDMWEAVRTGASFERMAQITAKLAKHQRAASACYKRLLARSQEDQGALRMYAQFSQVVEADSVRAQQILDLADGAEERQSRRNSHVHHGSPSDVTGHHSGAYAANALPDLSGDEPTAADTRSVTDDQSSSADDRVKLAFRGMKRAASQHGSQTSGSSTSRVARQRIMARRFMLDRLTKPLKSTWLTFACLILFLSALVVGFVLILNFMGVTSQTLAIEFAATRNGRRSTFGIFEGFRHMVYGNTVGDQAQWQRGFNQLRNGFNDLITYFLPILNKIETTISDHMPKYRLYSRSTINGTRTDYTPLNLNNIQIANLVSQAGALAMTYNQFGQLTNEVFNNLPELRFVSDNLIQIIEGCKYMPNAGIQLYLETASAVTVKLYVAMSLSLVFLFIFGAVTQIKVLRAYFQKEEQVQKIFMALPKRLASALLVDVDEELESFREITGADDLPEADRGAGVGASDRDQAGGTSANNTSHAGGAAVGKARAMRYSLLLALALAVVGGFVVTLFAVTLNALDVSKNTERLIQSTHRRQYSTVFRLISREYVSPPDQNGEWTIPTAAILPYMRTLLAEADELHSDLTADQEGLNAMLPALTIMPRNCSLPTACAAFPEAPEIGFTRAVLSMPLNTQYSRILEVGRDLVNEWLDTSARTTFRSSPAFKKWKLLEAISMDLIQRLSALDDELSDLIVDNNYANMSYIIVIFAALSVVTLVSFVAFVVLGIRRLDREAGVLVMLLHSIPPSMLKEAPEVSRFIESGGLMLMM